LRLEAELLRYRNLPSYILEERRRRANSLGAQYRYADQHHYAACVKAGQLSLQGALTLYDDFRQAAHHYTVQ